MSTFAAERSGASTCAPAAEADDEADAEKEGDEAASTRIFFAEAMSLAPEETKGSPSRLVICDLTLVASGLLQHGYI